MLETSFRSYKRIDYAGGEEVVEIDRSGGFIMVEVTASDSDVEFFPNVDLPTNYGGGIPVKTGETRRIPMIVYNFKATGACTVIAYKR